MIRKDYKERLELAYYIAFMMLGVGGILNYLIAIIYYGYYPSVFYTPMAIALGMTFIRYLYNGKHAWDSPIGRPSIIVIIGFIYLSIIFYSRYFS